MQMTQTPFSAELSVLKPNVCADAIQLCSTWVGNFLLETTAESAFSVAADLQAGAYSQGNTSVKTHIKY